ncbi:MAG: hypothetical protein IH599_08950 [Bacteroidales bacterium]|nr:hypothetical protein [Bacteroidales bacterium]
MKKFPPRAKRRREFELLEGIMALMAGEALEEALRAAAKVQQESGSQRVNAWA